MAHEVADDIAGSKVVELLDFQGLFTNEAGQVIGSFTGLGKVTKEPWKLRTFHI